MDLNEDIPAAFPSESQGWALELQRRLDAHRSGLVAGIPADEVLGLAVEQKPSTPDA